MTTNNNSEPGRQDDRHVTQEEIVAVVGAKEQRKLQARRSREHSVWFGLGMFGLVGWAVAMPTVIGIALGMWIDSRWPGSYSWTLTLLLLGIVLGCLNAWYWLSRERIRIENSRKGDQRD